MNNAGMPGTGIGGFFYLLLAFLMPFAELHRTIVGKSSWKRWKLVIRQVTIATGVVGGVEAAGWGARAGFGTKPVELKVAGIGVVTGGMYVAAPLLLSFGVLIVVLAVIRMWELAARVSEAWVANKR